MVAANELKPLKGPREQAWVTKRTPDEPDGLINHVGTKISWTIQHMKSSKYYDSNVLNETKPPDLGLSSVPRLVRTLSTNCYEKDFYT